jgi:hypothetical protein
LKRVHPDAYEQPGILVVPIPEGYNWIADSCELPDARQRIEETLREIANQPLSIRFQRPEAPPSTVGVPAPAIQDDVGSDPLVARAVELFEARPVHIERDESER